MPKKYVVRLTKAEREHLERLLRRGEAHARKLLYARILLKTDASGDGWTDERIAETFEVSTATVARERQRFCEDGLEVALLPKKPGRPRRRVLDGRAEAHLVGTLVLRSSRGTRALEHEAFSRPDDGTRVRGVDLLRDGQAHAQKNELRPHLKRQWVIPPRKSAAFVWRMEEVLDLYEEPYDSNRPVICFDERPCQLIGEVRDPLPVKPGEVRRIDSHYERKGTCHVLMAFEPLTGWREA